MSEKRLRPPAPAIWVLRYLTPAKNREDLTGDLLERFDEGRSGLWFWRQCLIASLVGLKMELRAHWSHIFLALLGTAVLMSPLWPPRWYSPEYWFWNGSPVPYRIFMSLRTELQIQQWPWMLRMIYNEGVFQILNAVLVAPFLATLLILNKAFSWVKVFRLFLNSVLLLSSAGLISQPNGWERGCTIFLALLVSAWVSCPSPADSIAPVSSESVG